MISRHKCIPEGEWHKNR